jgi:putative peptide zinc metalloprotease protein
MFAPDSRVRVHPFTVLQEGEEFVLGQAGGAYIAVPGEAIEILETLRGGKTLAEVQELFFERHGERPDLDEFLAGLERRGFVEREGQNDAGPPRPAPIASAWEGEAETGVLPLLARWLFGPTALALYALVILAAGAAIVIHPAIVPGRSSLFFPRHRTLNGLLLLGFTCVSVWLHEIGHLLAARSVGVKSRIGIGNRLWVVVAETDLSGLWSVPRQRRYLPFLAGCLVDLVSASLLLLVLYAEAAGRLRLSPWPHQFVGAMVFVDFMRLLWQCYLFVRTDFYYVIATLTGCKNLLEDTAVFLRNQLARVIPRIRRTDQSAIPRREMRVIRVYSVIWLVGRLLSLGVLVLVTIPLVAFYTRSLAAAVRLGIAAHPYTFLDTLFVTAAFFIPLSLGMTLWIRSLFRLRRLKP